jgi:hypothetical protein
MRGRLADFRQHAPAAGAFLACRNRDFHMRIVAIGAGLWIYENIFLVPKRFVGNDPKARDDRKFSPFVRCELIRKWGTAEFD